MGKSKERILFGVKSCKMQSGGFKAGEWAALRAPDAWGFMKDEDGGHIFWFNDPGARDDFLSIFGGLSVTLQRKDEVLTGERAETFLKKAKVMV